MRHLRMHAAMHTVQLERGVVVVCMQQGARGQIDTHRLCGLLKVDMASGLIV